MSAPSFNLELRRREKVEVEVRRQLGGKQRLTAKR
jgi:hypothetical protein